MLVRRGSATLRAMTTAESGYGDCAYKSQMSYSLGLSFGNCDACDALAIFLSRLVITGRIRPLWKIVTEPGDILFRLPLKGFR